jgi:hypothetical protein
MFSSGAMENPNSGTYLTELRRLQIAAFYKVLPQGKEIDPNRSGIGEDWVC